MSFTYFIKLLLKNLLWLIIVPVAMACSIFYFTRKEIKVYSSESVIYTGIASGYSLSGNNKADFFATSNAFDNLLSLINSRETKKEVAISLLANHLFMKKYDPALISQSAYSNLKILVPENIRRAVVKPTLDSTISALHGYLTSGEENLIYSILNSDNSFYSYSALDKIKANRINSSDLIKIAYETNDAAICKQTLELLEESFMKKHRMLKEGQSQSVVEYFEQETRKAFARLNAAEESFMLFNKKNDIINYYEQTKAVAIEKENLDVQKHNLQMDEMASSKSLEKVNENIKGRVYQNEYGTNILKQREALSDANSKIALSEIIGKNVTANKEQVDSFRRAASVMEKNLRGSVNNLYLETLTPMGIPTKNVLDEWLKTTLGFEQSKARLTVMDERKKEFVETYRKYAPLGATLKKIERQINVTEQEYLELLKGLNVAKLTQQNNELTTKLNVVDAPFLPLKANASKRYLLVIVGFLVGFILVMIVILARALINKTLQQPEKAARAVGIPLLGIYPLLNSHPEFILKADLRLVQQFLSSVDTNVKPLTIGFVSLESGEGKTTLMNLLQTELTNQNLQVETHVWDRNKALFTGKSDIVLIEFPPLNKMIITPGMLPHLDNIFLVCRANRIWGKIDTALLGVFIKITGTKPTLLLNGVNPDFAEGYIGEVPRKRSFLRRSLKRLVKFEFGNRKKFR